VNKYSLIIPCYNCSQFIEKNIIKLIRKLNNLNIKYEIILIDDGSTDKTLEILKKINLSIKKIKILKNNFNIGKSFSSIKGIKISKYQKIILIDCDLPYFSDLKNIIFELNKGYDLVIINRKMEQSKLISKNLNLYQITRYIIGGLIAIINLKVLKLKIKGGDSQAGLKGFKKFKNFNKVKFLSKKFFFDLELISLYSKKKLSIKSIKTNYSVPSKSSIRIFNFSKNFEILCELLKVIKKYK
tara:strand:+ start:740 stop:1465 length:726 start_codon:yes stop_codon:yes gene_type:complete